MAVAIVTPLTIRAFRIRAVNAPLAEPVRTASGDILTAPLVLVDLMTEEGATGRSYLRCISPDVLEPLAALTANMGGALSGMTGTPTEITRKLQNRYRLLGLQGLVGMAIAGIDMAAWDAQAHAHAVPLVTLLGGAPVEVPAYASLGMLDEATAAEKCAVAAQAGYRGIKLKLGYPDAGRDHAVMRAARATVGTSVALMVDYNQSLDVAEAISRIRMLADCDLLWIEEPTLADDFEGHARISKAVETGVQIGENWMGVGDMRKCVAAGASRYAMFDAMKIGGVSGWIEAAGIAEGAGMPVSSHAFPEISGHLLAATAGRHWLEYLGTADPVLRQPSVIEKGCFVFPEGNSTGIDWDEAAVRRYAV